MPEVHVSNVWSLRTARPEPVEGCAADTPFKVSAPTEIASLRLQLHFRCVNRFEWRVLMASKLLSVEKQTAVNVIRLPGDEVGFLGCQKGHHISHVLGFGDTSQGCGLAR